ncbi:MAG: 4Fe-4S binding protein [Candidatus Helarchaeota archaeon]
MLVPLENIIHKLEGDQGDFIKPIRENCVACKRCITVCPVNLWYLDDGKANIKDDYKKLCLECGACWQSCEYNAIDFTYPKGGTGVIFKRG